MKNNKGFTLIELMIAIAIIGILALVLIPKVGGMKSQAKLAGMDTNLRISMSVIEGMITDYEATAAGAAQLETDIAARLDTNSTDKDIKNPITGFQGVVEFDAATAPDSGNVAFTYANDDITNAEVAAAVTNTTEVTDMKGVIYYQAWVDAASGDLKVTLFAHDDNGVNMAGKKKVVIK